MKHLAKFLLAATLAAAASAQITEFTLDERKLFQVPVSQTRITTFVFPCAISAIDAIGMTLDGSTPGLFQIAYQPTNFFFSLRALTNGATANINVVLRQKLYVIEVSESKTPTLSVIFREGPTPTAQPKIEKPRPTVTQLFGLLLKANNYLTLKTHHPALLVGTTNILLNCTNEYDSFKVQLTSVTRFDAEDTLVFCTLLSSKTGAKVYYDPQSVSIRVGSNVYHAAITDAAGVIYPDFPYPMTFAIVGSPDGQRNDLSPNNDFVVLLTPKSAPPPKGPSNEPSPTS